MKGFCKGSIIGITFLCVPLTAFSEEVTFQFNGQISYIRDELNVTNNTINVTDQFTGYFTYNDSDVNVPWYNSQDGDTSFTTASDGYGELSLLLNDQLYASDPNVENNLTFNNTRFTYDSTEREISSIGTSTLFTSPFQTDDPLSVNFTFQNNVDVTGVYSLEHNNLNIDYANSLWTGASIDIQSGNTMDGGGLTIVGDITSIPFVTDPPPAVYEPQTYGIFLNYDDQLNLSTYYDSLRFSGALTTAGIIDSSLFIDGSNVTLDASYLETEISNLNLQPEDTLYLYFSGHGGYYTNDEDDENGYYDTEYEEHNGEVVGISNEHENSAYVSNPGDEFISTGYDETENKYILITDDELTQILLPYQDVEKMIFLDSCHSGGFWGNWGEPSGGDLEHLDNIMLIAAATEDLSAQSYWGTDTTYAGRSLMSIALEDAYSFDSTGFLKADTGRNRDGIISEDDFRNGVLSKDEFNYWLANYDFPWSFQELTPFVIEKDHSGNIIIYEEGMFSPFVITSNDFVATSSYTPNEPVPEPATMLLFGTGLVGLIGSRLRKKQK